MVDGDNRKSFIKKSNGHRLHHLYFWVLADECGMLKNVLNILSSEVAGNTDNVPGDTALSKKTRLGIRSSLPNEEEKEKKKQKYRDGVEAALASIGQGMNDFNKMKVKSIAIQNMTATNDAIAQVRACIRSEEELIQKFKLSLLLATSEAEKELYEQFLTHHTSRIEDFVAEEIGLCGQRNKVIAAEQAREEAATGHGRRAKV
jgi:hypothetical protein